MAVTYRLSVMRPIERDVVSIHLFRCTLDEAGFRTYSCLNRQGEWVKYEEFAVVEPTLEIPGSLESELRRGVESIRSYSREIGEETMLEAKGALDTLRRIVSDVAEEALV